MFGKIFNRINTRELLNSGLIILFVLALKSAVFGNYMIPTGSMNPTIMEKDRIISNNLAYGLRLPFTKFYLAHWSSPQPGDIISFIYPGDNKTLYTKRVIGVPGDIVEVNGSKLAINNKVVKRHIYKAGNSHRIFKESLNNKTYFVQYSNFSSSDSPPLRIKVPDNQFFVMGDNRDNSFDSRTWGFVPEENIFGKLGVCYYSYDEYKNTLRLEKLGMVE